MFDGHQMLTGTTVVFRNGLITGVGEAVPEEADVVDGDGCTLLPGLIDAHVHTSRDGLRAALNFGVTTELEMQGHWTHAQRHSVAGSPDLADLRSTGFGITRRGG
ncbi:MAG: amidohydrolase family protein, partial [Actinomycetota bacterium]|nr:amidohydrolase family protein [Actinomycetota bacterium]